MERKQIRLACHTESKVMRVTMNAISGMECVLPAMGRESGDTARKNWMWRIFILNAAFRVQSSGNNSAVAVAF